jgi:osmotically inducible lipoprotein OsmB
MKKLVFVALLGLTAAACSTTEERVGGAAVGAGVGAVAGPVGAVAGGAVGAMAGPTVTHRVQASTRHTHRRRTVHHH